jgi:hypothetical protein
MARLEQILKEARKLPVEEQRPAYKTNEQERAWINTNRDDTLASGSRLMVIAW